MYKDYLSPIEDVIEDARNGKMFVLVDAEDRENEGDLVIPAQMCTPETINFMAKYGRGLICLSLTSDRAKQLDLQLMSPNNQSRHQTAFTVSIEAREGVTTGISAHDRAHTVSVAIDPTKSAEDIASPGHVFPLASNAWRPNALPGPRQYRPTGQGGPRPSQSTDPSSFPDVV